MSNVVEINRARAEREREARRKLADWVDDHAHLGTDFLREALRGALRAVETFEDMLRSH